MWSLTKVAVQCLEPEAQLEAAPHSRVALCSSLLFLAFYACPSCGLCWRLTRHPPQARARQHGHARLRSAVRLRATKPAGAVAAAARRGRPVPRRPDQRYYRVCSTMPTTAACVMWTAPQLRGGGGTGATSRRQRRVAVCAQHSRCRSCVLPPPH